MLRDSLNEDLDDSSSLSDILFSKKVKISKST